MGKVKCAHSFVIVSECDDMKKHVHGAIIVCAQGCGDTRRVWQDGTVEVLSKGKWIPMS